MKKFWNKKNGGYTMIELLVYMAMLSIILTVLIYIFVTILDLKINAQHTELIEEDGRFILQRMAYDINASASITSPGSGSSSALTFKICDDTYNYQVDGSNNLMLSINGTQYQLNSGGERIKPGTLSFTTFKNNGSQKNLIQVNFTLESTTNNRGGTSISSVPFVTTIGLR